MISAPGQIPGYPPGGLRKPLAPPDLLPTAGFSSVVTLLSVAFTDTSTDADGTIVAWDWDFGDGGSHGTTQNPTHVYASGGAKTVVLTVTDNRGGQGQVTHSVTPHTAPVAAFTSVRTLLSLTFTDTSTSADGTITGWDWDYGDGSSHGTTQNPTHAYTTVGNKTVVLTVTDSFGATNAISHTVAPDITRDGPSSAIRVPLSASDWTAISLPAPDYQWNCQEASGNLTDIIASAVLTANASPLYQQAVTNWTRKFVGTAGGTAVQGFGNSALAGLNLALNESYVMLVYLAVNFNGSGTQRILNMAGSQEGLTVPGTGLITTLHGGVGVLSAQAYASLTTVRPFLLYRRYNAGVSSTAGLFTDLESVVSVYSGTAQSALERTLGARAGANAPDSRFGLAAIWKGANADTVAAKTTLSTLGWTISY